MAKIMCSSCRALSELPDEYLGRQVRCKSCNAVFTATAVGSPAGLPSSALGTTATMDGVTSTYAKTQMSLGPNMADRGAHSSVWALAPDQPSTNSNIQSDDPAVTGRVNAKITCATPLTIEIRWAMVDSAYSSITESWSVGEWRTRNSTGWSLGLTFW